MLRMCCIMSTKKPKRRVTTRRASTSAPRRSSHADHADHAERPVAYTRVVGEIMGALLAAITFGALETE